MVLGVVLIILGLFVTYHPAPTVTAAKEAARASAELFPLTCGEPNLHSESGDFEVSLEFLNRRPTPVSVTWIDYDGKESMQPLIEPLGPGESRTVTTFLSHAFVVKDLVAGRCVQAFKVGGRHLVATVDEGR